jgi:hypothetical protein
MIFLATLLWLAMGEHNGPYTEWYRDQKNDLGQYCCDESDGHAYDGTYKLESDGSVTVFYEGKPQWIAAHKVLKGHNPTGHAIWWYLLTDEGEPISYCFSPGQLG